MCVYTYVYLKVYLNHYSVHLKLILHCKPTIIFLQIIGKNIQKVAYIPFPNFILFHFCVPEDFRSRLAILLIVLPQVFIFFTKRLLVLPVFNYIIVKYMFSGTILRFPTLLLDSLWSLSLLLCRTPIVHEYNPVCMSCLLFSGIFLFLYTYKHFC